MMKKRLLDRVAVVTGASSGVGRAVVRALAREGAHVGLIARDQDALEVAAAEVRELGSDALVLPLDVSDADAVQSAGRQVVATWGRIDVWVNDAMISVFGRVSDITPEEFRRVMEVNYLGYVHGTLTALSHMRTAAGGTIIQIGSALSYRSIPLQSAYCASKAAIRGFTDSLRCELLHDQSPVSLSLVHLPAVNTPQFEVVRNRLGDHPQPVPPIYQPEVIGRAVIDAVSEPRREIWIGWSTVKAIVGQRLFPGLLDKYLANKAWDSQTTTELPVGHPAHHLRDNIDSPLVGDQGAHGPFDDRARSYSSQRWVRRHLVLLIAVSAMLGVIALILWRLP